MSEHNYVEMTGRLHRWDVRETSTGAMARGWIEVKRIGAEGTTKFPLISWDPDPVWEEHEGNVVTLSGHLTWTRDGSRDARGDERWVVVVHVDAMQFVRAARNGGGSRNGRTNGARNGKTYKSSKSVAARKLDQATEASGENEDDLPF